MKKNRYLNRIGCGLFIALIAAIIVIGLTAIFRLIETRSGSLSTSSNVAVMITKRVKGGAEVLQTADIGSGLGSCRVALFKPQKGDVSDCGYALLDEHSEGKYRLERVVHGEEIDQHVSGIRVDTFSFRKAQYLIVVNTGDRLAKVEIKKGANISTVSVTDSPSMVLMEFPPESEYVFYDAAGSVIKPDYTYDQVN